MRIKPVKQFPFLFIVVCFVLCGCFSPWEGDETSITISIGGGNHRNTVRFTEEDISSFEHKIILNNGPGPDQDEVITGAGEVKFTVAPGYWNVSIEAYNDDKVLMAKGSQLRVRVRSGQTNTVSIQMIPYSEHEDHDIGIIVELWVHEGDGEILASDNNFIISEYDVSLQSSFTARVNGDYEKIQWFLLGYPIEGAENKNEITVYAADYNAGTYQLTVVVYTCDDVPYSTEITFEVKGRIFQ